MPCQQRHLGENDRVNGLDMEVTAEKKRLQAVISNKPRQTVADAQDMSDYHVCEA